MSEQNQVNDEEDNKIFEAISLIVDTMIENEIVESDGFNALIILPIRMWKVRGMSKEKYLDIIGLVWDGTNLKKKKSIDKNAQL